MIEVLECSPDMPFHLPSQCDFTLTLSENDDEEMKFDQAGDNTFLNPFNDYSISNRLS